MHEKIEDAVKQFADSNPDFPKIELIYEEELLETGGAIKNAAAVLGQGPIFTLNTDVILMSSGNIFDYLASKWRDDEMDFLLLMQNYEHAVGYRGHGDFDLAENGRLIKKDKEANYDFIYAGLQILKPQLVARHPLKIFSLREYYLNSPKVFGARAMHGARWYHASSPEDLVDIEMNLLAFGD
jgi:MurNAc alpha-1-phosphate uridylyltransferase